MRKAVAVPYVIALILGVAVIALLGIWFVSSGGKFTKGAVDTQCRAKAVEFCTRYSGVDRKVDNWNIVRGSLNCDLGNLGIAADTIPDCSKVLT